MEELLAKLHAYSRFLELEDSIPYWESQIPEQKARIREMTENLEKKEQALLDLEKPAFFRNLFRHRSRERLTNQIREITAARTAAQWEQESLEKRITAGIREQETLRNSAQAYKAAKRAVSLTPAQESRLLMEEISAFVPAAMETADRILAALESVRFWMQQGNPLSEQVEDICNAEAAALRLKGILGVLPEGIAASGSYLRSAQHFFDGADPLDKLNQAQEQMQTLRNQLRMLLGE